jgi:hypothetical protein
MESTTDLAEKRGELQRRRQTLAYVAEHGTALERAEAAEALEAVERESQQLETAVERAALAASEAGARAQAAAEAAAEAARRQAQERLNYVLVEVGTAALEVEAGWIKLEQAAKGLLELGRQAYALDNELRPGRPRQKLRLTDQVAGSLAWRLSELLPQHFARPDRQLRQPVPLLLAGLRGTGPAAAPEPDVD